MSVRVRTRPPPSPANGAPLIGARAATRRRIAMECGERRRDGELSARGWTSVLRPHSAASVAGIDAALIGERAATRGRSAMEGAMSTPVRGERYPFEIQLT